jgi:outer membrane biosynthesis protein TonB
MRKTMVARDSLHIETKKEEKGTMEIKTLIYLKAKTNSKDLCRFRREDGPGWSDLYLERALVGEEVPDRLEVTIVPFQDTPVQEVTEEPAQELIVETKAKKSRKPRQKPAMPQVPDVVPAGDF